MPDSPCWADLAARDYAADPEEAMYQACYALADEIQNTWTLAQLSSDLKPHEQETLDQLLADVAKRLITERADDNFIEPEAW